MTLNLYLKTQFQNIQRKYRNEMDSDKSTIIVVEFNKYLLVINTKQTKRVKNI